MEDERSLLEASFLQVDLLQNQMRNRVHEAQIRRGEPQQSDVVVIQVPARGGQQDVQRDSVHPVEIHAHPLRQSSLRSSRRLHRHRICPQTHSDVDASLSGGHFTPRLSGDDALRHHEAPDLTKRISSRTIIGRSEMGRAEKTDIIKPTTRWRCVIHLNLYKVKRLKSAIITKRHYTQFYTSTLYYFILIVFTY